MKALILYRPESEHSRSVEEFEQNFKRTTGLDIELIDVDTSEGTQKAEIYDILQYPAVVVTRDDGELVKHWVGVPLPLANDVRGHLA